MRRVLILTASFGEGHNTAAKNLRDALLQMPNTEAEISDLYQVTNPFFNQTLRHGYSVAINRYPHLWHFIFQLLSHPGLLESSVRTLRGLQDALSNEIEAFKPDAIVSTYPVYSFLLKRIQQHYKKPFPPYVTIITDSTRINSAWYRCHSTYFITTDSSTTAVLKAGGVPAEKIKTIGFPVDLRFEILPKLPPIPPNQWQILYMPSTRKNFTIRTLQRLLNIPNIHITILTGRNEALETAIMKADLPNRERLRMISWTTEIPELFCSHHLYLGKAGGAVVQEAIAGCCPFIVSHFVPGQEEGNIELIKKFNIGKNASGKIDNLVNALKSAIANNGKQWKQWKQNLESISHPDASRRAAEFILQVIETEKH